MYNAKKFKDDITASIAKLKPEEVENLNEIFEDDFNASDEKAEESTAECDDKHESSDETAEDACDVAEDTAAVKVSEETEAIDESCQSPGVDVMDREETIDEESDPEQLDIATEEEDKEYLPTSETSAEADKTLDFDSLNALFEEDLASNEDFDARKAIWRKNQSSLLKARLAKQEIETMEVLMNELGERMFSLNELANIPSGKTTKYPEVNLSFTPKEDAGALLADDPDDPDAKEDVLTVAGDVKAEVTVVQAREDAEFLADDLQAAIQKRMDSKLGDTLTKEMLKMFAEALEVSEKDITGAPGYTGKIFVQEDGSVMWEVMDTTSVYLVIFTEAGHDIDTHPNFKNSVQKFKKSMATSETAPAPDLKLKGEIVVMTGRPPKGYQKKDVASILKKKHGVKSVEPRFTKRTSVVIYNEDQLETKKLKAAEKAGLKVLPYKDLELE